MQQREESDPVKAESTIKHSKRETKEQKEKNWEYKQLLPPSFPNRLKNVELDRQYTKFLDVFKQLHINIPLLDALKSMPSYAKFIKDILSNKRKWEQYDTVALTEECSARLLNKVPPKLKDPGSFDIPCHIGNFNFMALCDLGASINLMPYSVYRKLGIGEVKPTQVSLQMADRSIKRPRGILEDVLVKVNKFVFPADFLVLDMETDEHLPLILGRPFLATGKALIDVQKGELTLRVLDEEVSFNVFKALKCPILDDASETCNLINVSDILVDECVKENEDHSLHVGEPKVENFEEDIREFESVPYVRKIEDLD